MIQLIFAIGIPLFHVMGLLSAFHAVMNARTSQGSIAWAVSLILMPYIAVPAYWILGRSRFNGYVTARRSDNVRVQEKLATMMEQMLPYCVPKTEIGAAWAVAQRLAVLPYVAGNAIDLLIDGDATFDSILAGIDSATSYILFQFYIVKDDDIGRLVKTHLIAKAKEGVNIYFLYDEVGSYNLPETYKNELRDAGVQIYDFHTRQGPRNRFQINFRNHRKIVIVDGKVAWIGGHNVGDEYLGRDPKFGHWRDTHIRIEGPATISVQISFAEDWNWAAGTPIPELVWTPTASPTGTLPVLIVPSGPADKLETASLMFLHAINSAKKRIWITSPYFVPDDAILSALQLAGLRGVDVRILIPDTVDHLIVYMAEFSYFDDASKTGVRFFRYTDGFLHQKVMLVDDTTATVGTANFDNRSFRLNFEITGIVADEAFARQVEQMLETDLAHSREMTQADVDGLSFWFKLGARLARLASPIL